MKKRVLVVDDDAATRRLLVELLREFDVDVYEADQDEDAYRKYLEAGPDLVLLDVLLPRQGGVELLRRIRGVRGGADVPVLVMSAVYRGADIRRQVVDGLGAVDFLKKPFNLAQLRDQMARFLAGDEPQDEEPLQPFVLPDMLSRGSLASVDFPVVLRDLAAHATTACVHLRLGRCRKVLFLRDGRVEFALSNRLPETLGRYLLSRGRIDEDAYRRGIEAMSSTGQRLGEYLVSQGLVGLEAIGDAVRQNVLEKALDVFSWTSGDFRIADYQEPPASLPGHPFEVHRLLWDGIRGHVPFDRISSALSPYGDLVLAPRRDLFELASEVSLEKEDLQFLRVLRRLRGQPLSHALGKVRGEGEVRILYYLLLQQYLGLARAGAEGTGLAGLDLPDRERVRRARRQLEALRSRNHFQVLDVPLSTTDEQVRQAYLERAKEVHPDMLAPSDPPALHQIHGELFRLIQAAYDGIKTATRRKEYLRFLEETPDDAAATDSAQVLEAEALFQQGRLMLNRRQWDAAADLLRQALDLNPDEGEYVLSLGVARMRQAAGGRTGALEDAEALFRRARELLPDEADPCYHLGRVRAQMGDPAGAVALYRAAVNRDPHHVDALRELRLLEMRGSGRKKVLAGRKGKR